MRACTGQVFPLHPHPISTHNKHWYWANGFLVYTLEDPIADVRCVGPVPDVRRVGNDATGPCGGTCEHIVAVRRLLSLEPQEGLQGAHEDVMEHAPEDVVDDDEVEDVVDEDEVDEDEVQEDEVQEDVVEEDAKWTLHYPLDELTAYCMN